MTAVLEAKLMVLLDLRLYDDGKKKEKKSEKNINVKMCMLTWVL